MAGVGEGFVCAEAGAAGEGEGDEAALKDRLDDVGEGVVDHAVSERGGRNQPWFGVGDGEGAVGAGAVGLVCEFSHEAVDFWFEVGAEGSDIGAGVLADGCAGGGMEEISRG